jgi:hypothetical protein
MKRGFAYASPYTFTPGQLQRLGWATLLRPPIACLLPVRVARSTGVGPKTNTSFGRLASPGSTWARGCGYGNINPLSIGLRLSACP